MSLLFVRGETAREMFSAGAARAASGACPLQEMEA